MQNRWQPLQWKELEQDVNMVWHDTPCLQPIASLMEVLQSRNYHFGDLRLRQMTGSRPKVKMTFYALRC